MDTTDQLITELLTKAVGVCFEGMVFTEPAVLDESDEESFIPWETIPYLFARIKTDEVGYLFLVVPNELLIEITEILGSDQPDDLDIINITKDTISEILNQLAGEFMNDFLGKEKVYQLGIPEISLVPFDSSHYNHVVNFKINASKISAGFDPSHE